MENKQNLEEFLRSELPDHLDQQCRDYAGIVKDTEPTEDQKKDYILRLSTAYSGFAGALI